MPILPTTADNTPARDASVRDGVAVHDHGIVDAAGCPRACLDCTPLARYASPDFESFMCCGLTASAPVPTDRLRLCIKSTHKHGVDVLVNLDERDTVHTASVLLAGLSALGSVQISATDSLAGAPVPASDRSRSTTHAGDLS